MEPPSEPDDATPAEWDHLEDELRREGDPGARAETRPDLGHRAGRSSARTAPTSLLGLGPEVRDSDQPAEPGSGSDDPLAMYPAEHERGLSSRPQAHVPRVPRLALGPPLRRVMVWVLVGVAAILLVAVAVRYLPARASPPPPLASGPGTVVIESRPPAASVSVDGRPRGVTPARLSLPAGTYVFTIQFGEARRQITRKVEPGAQIYEYLDLPQPAKVKTGQLSVTTSPPGARVIVDGIDRGVSPIELTGLAAGIHSVTLGEGRTSVNQRVTIQAGATSTLVVPLASGRGQFGYLTVASAVPVDVLQDGNLLGSSQSARITMPAGRHTLDIANDSLGFRTARPVTIAPGAVSRLSVELPNGTLSVNAMPWAEVLMDGRLIGETPIANVAARIGPHELIFRHPQLGEQRRTVTVTLKAPARVGVDLRQ